MDQCEQCELVVICECDQWWVAVSGTIWSLICLCVKIVSFELRWIWCERWCLHLVMHDCESLCCDICVSAVMYICEWFDHRCMYVCTYVRKYVCMHGSDAEVSLMGVMYGVLCHPYLWLWYVVIYEWLDDVYLWVMGSQTCISGRWCWSVLYECCVQSHMSTSSHPLPTPTSGQPQHSPFV